MLHEHHESDLAAALDQFDRAEANVAKLEAVWQQLVSLMPDVPIFDLTDPEKSYELSRAFVDISKALPAIDGFKITSVPMSPEEITRARIDALDLDDVRVTITLDEHIHEPGRQLADYRYRLDRSRRNLVRNQVMVIISQINQVLQDARPSKSYREAEWAAESRWSELSNLVSELDRLVGRIVPASAPWNDLRRHIHFAQPVDLHDIVTTDWPSVRGDVETSLYDDREPIPILVDDLGALASTRPTGTVSTRLMWEALSDDRFERLLFELIRQAPGYENANWLMKTHAADRGRDLEVYRVVSDELGGTRRYRVIVQCKHWLERTVGRSELIDCVETVKLWEPPPIDVLIVATTGRFSQDAVALVEKRNTDRVLPTVEMWPDSHLETLLSRRPALAASFGLR